MTEDELTARVREIRARKAAHDAWAAELAALGPQPTVPPKRPPAPPASPTDEDVAGATATLEAVAKAEGAREERTRRRTDLARNLRASEVTQQAAAAEVERCEALVRACRLAPSEVARATVAALGDMGPVSLEILPNPQRGDPAVKVRLFGRRFDAASTGEQILGDYLFRLVLRRAARIRALPIIVDQAQDWSGDLPPADGPVWRLVTREGDLEVSDG